MQSLCHSCSHVRQVVSGTGSRFLLCRRAEHDPKFSKYPPQPVARCEGYEQAESQSFTLELLPETLAICRLRGDEPIPSWVSGDFLSVTRTKDELSVVCAQSCIPEGVRRESNWRGLRVVGPLDFSQVGVLSTLSAVLAAAGVSVFVVSTFDTDYLLVQHARLAIAQSALQQAGHDCQDERPTN